MMDADKQVAFIPFHAINEFMRSEYRQQVIQFTLKNLLSLPEETRANLNQLIKKHVKVPGFRNSAVAPTPLKTRPTVTAFEKKPELVAGILNSWSILHSELRLQVYNLLMARGWEVLPPETDRSVLPGFLTRWPKDEDFDVLNEAFKIAYPVSTANPDDVALMTVWISGRLPMEKVSSEPIEDEPEN